MAGNPQKQVFLGAGGCTGKIECFILQMEKASLDITYNFTISLQWTKSLTLPHHSKQLSILLTVRNSMPLYVQVIFPVTASYPNKISAPIVQHENSPALNPSPKHSSVLALEGQKPKQMTHGIRPCEFCHGHGSFFLKELDYLNKGGGSLHWNNVSWNFLQGLHRTNVLAPTPLPQFHPILWPPMCTSKPKIQTKIHTAMLVWQYETIPF